MTKPAIKLDSSTIGFAVEVKGGGAEMKQPKEAEKFHEKLLRFKMDV